MRKKMPGRGQAVKHLFRFVRELDGEWITARELERVSGRARGTVLSVLNKLEASEEYEVVRGVGRGNYTIARLRK